MASAQVMKKQEHLEAGKRKLEEFRRKKAAEKAKKSAQTSKVDASNKKVSEITKDSESGNVRVNDSNGAVTSNNRVEQSENINNNDMINSSTNHSFSSVNHLKDKDFRSISDNKENVVSEEDSISSHMPLNGTSSYHGHKESSINNSVSVLPQERSGSVGSTISISLSEFEKSNDALGRSKVSSSNQIFDNNNNNTSPWRSDINGELNFNGNNKRTSRPSFLEVINISKEASDFSIKPNPIDSSVSKTFMDTSITYEAKSETKQDLYMQKQNEDFAALEQHIEDLTQEKFSFQRALEASRVLAESLASENSSLTESYNQQGSVVNQLRYEMEMLQEEIKSQLVELESVKLEYGHAQLECNAADERAKLLASEVIGLEEKALRLRSNELKLERELENTQAQVSSLKKKLSSLERERGDLQSTIDALQEEKKLLQSKLMKAFTTEKSVKKKKEMSTSTEDLANSVDTSNTASTTLNLGNNTSEFNVDELLSLSIPHDQIRTIQNINTLISELALEKEELIQALSSELSQTAKLKELNKELIGKLEAQTQRLELLTSQSMSVSENIPKKRVAVDDSRNMHDSITYADEGDEVVERVLGWIMKLFPGGPSKRRTSKLL